MNQYNDEDRQQHQLRRVSDYDTALTPDASAAAFSASASSSMSMSTSTSDQDQRLQIQDLQVKAMNPSVEANAEDAPRKPPSAAGDADSESKSVAATVGSASTPKKLSLNLNEQFKSTGASLLAKYKPPLLSNNCLSLENAMSTAEKQKLVELKKIIADIKEKETQTQAKPLLWDKPSFGPGSEADPNASDDTLRKRQRVDEQPYSCLSIAERQVQEHTRTLFHNPTALSHRNHGSDGIGPFNWSQEQVDGLVAFSNTWDDYEPAHKRRRLNKKGGEPCRR